MLALAIIAGLGVAVGAIGLGVDAYYSGEQLESNEASLELQKEQLELNEEAADYEYQQGIVDQANAAAMSIDTLEQSSIEAGFYQTQFGDKASQVTKERDDALSMFDSGAAQTKGSQKVSLALSVRS